MKTHNTFSFAVSLVLVLFSIMIPTGAFPASTDGATVTISVDAAFYSADQPVIVHVTIANPTRHPLKVLKWYTPADDVEGPLFSVHQNGQPVAYIGPLYKRPKPVHEDYVNLKSGESITHDVDLALYYDLSVSGNYSIIYDVSSRELYSEKGNGKKDADRLTSNEIKVSITGRESGVSPSIVPLAVTGTTSYTKCTVTQQSILTAARAQASTYSADASSYLNAGTLDSRYTTWFGYYDTSRYGTVTSHFSSILNAMNTANITFDCKCKKKYYAYVFPNKPYVIHLCRVYWTAPPTGTDSQAGTLIHEMSHFNTVAGTNDWVYGQSGAMSLAITDPEEAVTNADNHEYFAENNPQLP
jgi:peptidyl-Lys metalloendopeptidase